MRFSIVLFKFVKHLLSNFVFKIAKFCFTNAQLPLELQDYFMGKKHLFRQSTFLWYIFSLPFLLMSIMNGLEVIRSLLSFFFRLQIMGFKTLMAFDTYVATGDLFREAHYFL